MEKVPAMGIPMIRFILDKPFDPTYEQRWFALYKRLDDLVLGALDDASTKNGALLFMGRYFMAVGLWGDIGYRSFHRKLSDPNLSETGFSGSSTLVFLNSRKATGALLEDYLDIVKKGSKLFGTLKYEVFKYDFGEIGSNRGI